MCAIKSAWTAGDAAMISVGGLITELPLQEAPVQQSLWTSLTEHITWLGLVMSAT